MSTLSDPQQLCEALGIPFSEQQLAAITADLEPGVIIAGAGSGKTTVMAARVVWLVGTGAVRPEEVLGLTFTRKAAAELSTRVRQALADAGVADASSPFGGGDDFGEQLIMTYDAFAARLVSEHGLRIGVEAEPTMVTGATRFRLASRVVNSAAGPFEFLSRLRPQSIVERVLQLDGGLQSHLVPRGSLDQHARMTRLALESAPLTRGNRYADVKKAIAALEERLELASLVDDYQRLKDRLGVVEFSDQMAVAARLSREVPEVSEIVRENFKVVLLDEYQDTSAAQALMLQGLFSGADAGVGRGHPVTAVGDPFQAIYGWRGAAASNILQFSTDFPRSDDTAARHFSLTVNRRSGHRILAVANDLAAPLRQDPLLASDMSDRALVAPDSAATGTVRAASFDTWPEEVAWIGGQVAAARDTGTVGHWSDIAVLSRRNADIGALYAELTGRDIPVEIVGLGGLLDLPEVADVVASLRLVDDVTANPDLVRLLGGPRWSIGPNDLALLGRRARELANQSPGAPDESEDLDVALDDVVADIDPTEVISLLDAVADPGELEFSEQARERFALFSAELADLRAHAGEPVLDLTRRVIELLGLDVELVATPQFARTDRRNQLAVFVDAVADYVDVDGDASLTGLLAYLRAESEHGAGLDQAVPTDADSVKLLTIHKAKGLEWPMVFLPGLADKVFPSDRVTDNWTSNPAELPAELRGDAESIPQLEDATNTGLKDYKAALKGQARRSEDRLAYVAVTRAKTTLIGTTHTWMPNLTRPRKPGDYFLAILAEAERQDGVAHRATAVNDGDRNPIDVAAQPVPWPQPLDAEALQQRRHAADLVARARQHFVCTGSHEEAGDEPMLLDTAELVAGWDADAERLLAEEAENRRPARTVRMPARMSATTLLRAGADPEGFAAELLRPMPRPPSPAGRFGTRFHRWVEQHYGARGADAAQLVDPDELPDRADAGVGDEAALRRLCEKFTRGSFAERLPAELEYAFSLLLNGQTIGGRIDAIFPAEPGSGHDWQVVDWKTGRASEVDPYQLALYRLAWAELRGVGVERVDAVFYFVDSDTVRRPDSLPDRAALSERFRFDAPGG